MPHDLAVAQIRAFQLAHTLTASDMIFEVEGEFDVPPSDELNDADVLALHKFDPFLFGQDHGAGFVRINACRSRAGGRKGGCAAAD